jgi:toxin-antitoxin system PIN domain toxin
MLPDVNFLVYAYDETSKNHAQAKRWWEDLLNGSQMIGLSWVTILGFIRLLTNRRIYQNPYSHKEILDIVKTWLEQPHVKIIDPSEEHFTRLASLIEHVGTAGNLTTDAHLAALAIERGLILQTTDADFARFPGLKWKNPLN